MPSLSSLLGLGLGMLFTTPLFAQNYQTRTIPQIMRIPADSLKAGSVQSAFQGDTVIVQGIACVPVLLDPAKGDRRPLMVSGGKAWTTYLRTPEGSAEQAGISVVQNDTLIKQSGFDQVRAGDLIEIVARVGSQPVQFDGPNQRRRSLPVLELITSVPVKKLQSNIPQPASPTLPLSTFQRENDAQLESGIVYAGRKVRFDSLTVVQISPVVALSDDNGNTIILNDQSGNFTTKNHYIEESTYRLPVVGQKVYKIEGFINSFYLPSGMMNGSQIFTYSIAPAVVQDVNLGPQPAQLTVLRITPPRLFPSAQDNMNISFEYFPGANPVNPSDIKLEYSLNNGATWTALVAEEDFTGNYAATIPAQPAGSIVRYRLVATDNKNNRSVSPAIGSYYYRVVNALPSIADIRRPDTIKGQRFSQNMSVTVQGIVMADSADQPGDNFQYPARIIVQDDNKPWCGAAFFNFGGQNPALSAKRGQRVRITGKVQDFGGGGLNFQSVDSFTVLEMAMPLAPVKLSTAVFTDAPGGTADADQWRNMLVEFNDAEISTVEPSAPQRTGEFIVVDAALKNSPLQGIRVETDESNITYSTRDSVIAISKRVKPVAGTPLSFIRGIIGIDFRNGRYKLIPRSDADFSSVPSSIQENTEIVQENTLAPNPVTGISTLNFAIAKKGAVTVKIMNATGAVQQSVLDIPMAEPGNYAVHIDGSRLSSGIYYAIISLPEGNILQSFTVQN